MTEYFNDNGDFRYVAKEFSYMEIRTTCEYHVVKNDKLIGPDSASQRFSKITLYPKDEIDVFCDERYSIMVKPLKPRGERPDPHSLVETIEAEEMTMYEKLRQEMLGKLSEIAHNNDLDTYDEDDDLGWEEEDETPLTPYEYAEMQEENIQEENIQEQTTEAPTPPNLPEDTPSESVAQKDTPEATQEAAQA